MVHLVTGGSGSGKSEYGENWLTGKLKSDENCPTKKEPYLYIATMEPFGEEAKSRIEKHRRMRKTKGFLTLECYRNLKELNIKKELNQEVGGILLECMSNLVANELYLPDGSMKKEKEVIEAVLKGVENLKSQNDQLVIVTNEVSSDGICYSTETGIYQQVLGKINQQLAEGADLVTEVVYGIPVRLKANTDSEITSNRSLNIEVAKYQ